MWHAFGHLVAMLRVVGSMKMVKFFPQHLWILHVVLVWTRLKARQNDGQVSLTVQNSLFQPQSPTHAQNQTGTRNSWFRFLNHPEPLRFPAIGQTQALGTRLRLATFVRYCCIGACALVRFCAIQHVMLRHIAIGLPNVCNSLCTAMFRYVEILHPFGQPLHNISQHDSTMLRDVPLNCCVRLAGALNRLRPL